MVVAICMYVSEEAESAQRKKAGVYGAQGAQPLHREFLLLCAEHRSLNGEKLYS